MANKLRFVKVTEATADSLDRFAILRILASDDVLLATPNEDQARFQSVQAAVECFRLNRGSAPNNRDELQVVDEDDLWPKELPPLE